MRRCTCSSTAATGGRWTRATTASSPTSSTRPGRRPCSSTTTSVRPSPSIPSSPRRTAPLRWTFRNIAGYGGDPRQLYVSGKLGRRTPHRDGPRSRLAGGRGSAGRHHQGRDADHRRIRLRTCARHHGQRAGPPRSGDRTAPESAAQPAAARAACPRRGGRGRAAPVGPDVEGLRERYAASTASSASTWSCPTTTISTSAGPRAIRRVRSPRQCCG